jgi:antitoxin component YwqK of YwqJK toxin-antitoxin module
MRHILASMVLAALLFPTLALGGEVKFEDLVITNGLHYKKFTNVPFTGKVTEGREQGRLKDGKRIGVWVLYNKDGRVSNEVTYENGKKDTLVVYRHHDNGQLSYKGTFKDGKKIFD